MNGENAAAPPGETPDPARIVVRASLVRCLITAALGLPVAAVLVLHDPPSAAVDGLLRLGGILIGMGALGRIALVVRRWYFTFDTRRRTVTASGRWRHKGTYPARGYERIEYSVYDSRVYEVSADGRRRRLPIRRRVADRRDWARFVDLLMRDLPAPTTERRVETVEVRLRRVRLLVTGTVMFAAYVAASYLLPQANSRLEDLLRGFVCGFLIGISVVLVRFALSKRYLSFDLRTGRLHGPGAKHWWQSWPHGRFARIEYSVYDARLYEVRTGKRHRLPLYRWAANPADWKALVDALLTSSPDSEDAAEDRTDHR